jgi:hypothetical protein
MQVTVCGGLLFLLKLSQKQPSNLGMTPPYIPFDTYEHSIKTAGLGSWAIALVGA